MAKIKTTKRFKDGINAAFETQKTKADGRGRSVDGGKVDEEALRDLPSVPKSPSVQPPYRRLPN